MDRIERNPCFPASPPSERPHPPSENFCTPGSPPSEPRIRTPCLGESSRSFRSNRGSADPNPGTYGTPFGHFRESEPAAWPDWVWFDREKGGVYRVGVMVGGLRRVGGNLCAAFFASGRKFSGNAFEKFAGNFYSEKV